MPSRDPDLGPPLGLGARLRDRAAAIRRAVLRHRRLLAVVCTAGAVAVGVRAAAPPEPPTVPVLVAGHDLPAGAVLGGDDLRTVELPPDAVPDAVVADAAGAILAAPLRTGEPVTDVRLVGPDLAAEAPGTVAVPVRLSDAGQAGLLTVGDRIDLLATEPESRTTSTVADDVVVLALPAIEAAGPDGALSGRLIVVGIPAATVHQVTSAAVSSFVTYAWAGR